MQDLIFKILKIPFYKKERSDWNKLSLTAGCKARLGEIYTILGAKHIFNAIETHDSLKFSSWKDALNESNYKFLRPVVIELLESKDTNADENGPILNQKFNSATHILSRSETHDSLKFLSWKDASNEPNYEILRPMVIEILESKDNNADETGPILNQKFNNSKISEVTCMFHTSKFLFWSSA